MIQGRFTHNNHFSGALRLCSFCCGQEKDHWMIFCLSLWRFSLHRITRLIKQNKSHLLKINSYNCLENTTNKICCREIGDSPLQTPLPSVSLHYVSGDAWCCQRERGWELSACSGDAMPQMCLFCQAVIFLMSCEGGEARGSVMNWTELHCCSDKLQTCILQPED